MRPLVLGAMALFVVGLARGESLLQRVPTSWQITLSAPDSKAASTTVTLDRGGGKIGPERTPGWNCVYSQVKTRDTRGRNTTEERVELECTSASGAIAGTFARCGSQTDAHQAYWLSDVRSASLLLGRLGSDERTMVTLQCAPPDRRIRVE